MQKKAVHRRKEPAHLVTVVLPDPTFSLWPSAPATHPGSMEASKALPSFLPYLFSLPQPASSCAELSVQPCAGFNIEFWVLSCVRCGRGERGCGGRSWTCLSCRHQAPTFVGSVRAEVRKVGEDRTRLPDRSQGPLADGPFRRGHRSRNQGERRGRLPLGGGGPTCLQVNNPQRRNRPGLACLLGQRDEIVLSLDRGQSRSRSGCSRCGRLLVVHHLPYLGLHLALSHWTESHLVHLHAQKVHLHGCELTGSASEVETVTLESDPEGGNGLEPRPLVRRHLTADVRFTHFKTLGARDKIDVHPGTAAVPMPQVRGRMGTLCSLRPSHPDGRIRRVLHEDLAGVGRGIGILKQDSTKPISKGVST